jgi:predicted PurR-regulated permease PerM
VVFLAFYFLSDIVAYVLISWILALLGRPVMNFLLNRLKLKRYKVGPSVAALSTMLLYAFIVTLIVWLFVPPILEQAANFRDMDYGNVYVALEDPLRRLENNLMDWGVIDSTQEVQAQIESIVERWFSPAKVGTLFTSVISVAGNLLFAIFSILFITFFFLRESSLFSNFLIALTPAKYESEMQAVVTDSIGMLTRYFGGIFIQVTVVTVFLFILLSIVGIKYALLIAFFAALVNVIPYLGVFIGAIFAMIMAISTHLDAAFYVETLPIILKVAGVFIAMQLFDNFIVQPTVFSNVIRAHPLEIFIVILIGAKIAEIPGMILAIPVYTVIRVIAKVFLSEFKIVQKLTRDL